MNKDTKHLITNKIFLAKHIKTYYIRINILISGFMKSRTKILLIPILILMLALQVIALPGSCITGPFKPLSTDTILLPFTEIWDQGTFTYHNWIHSGNWSVNTSAGNPAPSSDYTGQPAHTNYNDTLQSVTLSAEKFSCAAIYLDFDYKLIDQNHTGAEFLTIEKRTDSAWIAIAEYSNNGDIPWTSRHYELRLFSGKTFCIRFRAHGSHSQDISHWFVDNISVYAVCRPPANLTCIQSHYNVTLSWQSPACSNSGPPSQWIHWDNGVNNTSIGAACPCQWDMAAHWTPDQIANLDGGSITKISFFPVSVTTTTFRARIWKGPMADMILDENIPSVVSDQWNTFTLNVPSMIDVTTDLWVGIFINQTWDPWPGGCDAGPAVNGYGDMIYINGYWETLLSACGCNYNWNLQAYVENLKSATKPVILPPPTMPEQNITLIVNNVTNKHRVPFNGVIRPENPEDKSVLIGYNVWRTDSKADTSTYHKINNALVTDTTFMDNISNDSLGIYKYYVTAVMNDSVSSSFLCESPGGNRLILSIPAVGISENGTVQIMIYPNPAVEYVNVKSDQTINSIEVMNYTGQIVYSKNAVNSKSSQINVSALQAGIYFIKFTTEKAAGIIKITVIH